MMNSQFPSFNSPQRLNVATPTASNYVKVPLRPGHSLMDWIRLTKSNVDLRGVGPKMLEVSEEELAKHNAPDDAWMAIRGFVYNVSKYMSYHPGGAEELMRGVGKDATLLFNEIHNWVNFESMLKACLIGRLVQRKPTNKILNSSNFLKPPMNAPLKLKPPNNIEVGQKLKLDSAAHLVKLSTEWLQTDANIIIAFRTGEPLQENDAVCDLNKNGCHLKGCIFVKSQVVLIDIRFPHSVDNSILVSLNQAKKTLDICLQKSQKNVDWSSLEFGKKHCTTIDRKSLELEYRMCKLIEKSVVTHDTFLFQLQLPQTCHMSVPIGHHVYLQADIDGICISRPYTVISPTIFQEYGKLSKPQQDIYLMIKTYQYGSLTPFLKNLKVGDSILLSTYEGSFRLDALKPHNEIVMFCGGTGFTPMVRVMQHCLFETNKKVKLFFYNKTNNDILWKNQLIELMQQKSDRFQVHHILSQPEKDWKGKSGRITIDHIKEAFNASPMSAFACVCGPPLFSKLAVELLRQLGVVEKNMHIFSS